MVHERHGHIFRLVGHDAPGDILGCQPGDELAHAVERVRVTRHAGFVGGHELSIQGVVTVVARGPPEGLADHAAPAVRAQGRQLGLGQTSQAACLAHVVGCPGQVGGGMDHGAVQIEQHRARVRCGHA